MNVEELIQSLQELVQNNPSLAKAEVLASYDYGDYHRTEALVKVRCLVYTHVMASAYSDSGLRIVDPEETADIEDPEELPERAVVLGKRFKDRYFYE